MPGRDGSRRTFPKEKKRKRRRKGEATPLRPCHRPTPAGGQETMDTGACFELLSFFQKINYNHLIQVPHWMEV